MKKRFFETKFGIILKSIGVGAVKGISGPLGGAVDEVITNVSSPEFGEGNIDWARLVGYLTGVAVFFALLYLFIKGQINADEFEQLWKLFN